MWKQIISELAGEIKSVFVAWDKHSGYLARLWLKFKVPVMPEDTPVQLHTVYLYVEYF